MQRDTTHLADIVACCDRIAELVSGRSMEEFLDDDGFQESVLWNLAVAGEAVRHLSLEFVDANPSELWRNASDMRNRILHGYSSVDLEIVWDTATAHLSELRDLANKLIPG